MFASDFERRVVAHLPKYRTPAQRKEAEGKMLKADPRKDKDWRLPQSRTAAELAAALRGDEYAVDPSGGDPRDPVGEWPSDEACQEALDALEERGYVKSAGDAYSMTRDGLEALTA